MGITRHVPAARWLHLQSKRHQHSSPHTESDSKAHQLFRSDPAHAVEARQATKVNEENDMIPGIDRQASTGVLYVSERATANGWVQGEESEWAGLGQGAPETGLLPDGRERIKSLNVEELGGDNLFEVGYIISYHPQ